MSSTVWTQCSTSPEQWCYVCASHARRMQPSCAIASIVAGAGSSLELSTSLCVHYFFALAPSCDFLGRGPAGILWRFCSITPAVVSQCAEPQCGQSALPGACGLHPMSCMYPGVYREGCTYGVTQQLSHRLLNTQRQCAACDGHTSPLFLITAVSSICTPLVQIAAVLCTSMAWAASTA